MKRAIAGGGIFFREMDGDNKPLAFPLLVLYSF